MKKEPNQTTPDYLASNPMLSEVRQTSTEEENPFNDFYTETQPRTCGRSTWLLAK